MADRPTVLLLATGGTIANPPDVDGYLSGRELLDEVPEVESIADVDVVDVARTGSSGITFENWWDLHAAVERAVAEDPPDGIVVTHGSNTVEETAYFLHLTAKTSLPIVLTAAQRNHRLVGNDGDRNLVDAVRVAGSPEARGRGAMVVLNDEIHSAREVTKMVSGRPDAWSSGNLGVLGQLDKEGEMAFFRRTEKRHAPDTEFDVGDVEPGDVPRVEIVYSAVNADGTMVEAAVDAGADGIVLCALPTGTAARAGQAEAARTAHEDGTPVVLTHRGFDGWPYDTGEYIWGNTLTPQKARVLLALALTETRDYDRIERMFRDY